MSRRETRAVGLLGLGSFVLIISAALLAPPLWKAPGTRASPAQIVVYVGENRGRTLASLFIYSIAIGLLLCFTAGLWTWLRRREPAQQAISAVFGFGAVALAVLILAGFVPGAIVTYRPQDPAVAQALRDMTFGLLALSGVPTAVCLGAYATLVIRSGCLPRWTGWVAVLGVITHICIAASFLSHGDFLSLESAVILWAPATLFAWILATSLVLLGPLPAGHSR